jgi:ATP-dependent DNA helicase DinG
VKRIENIFKPGGILSQKLDDYEYRPVQQQMAAAVWETVGAGGQLVVEAGTGTGKTLAYLVPSVLSGERVVISTGTKNLQEQVFYKDIPFLREELGMEFSAVMLKGRSNYLCPMRLNRFSQTPLFKKESDEKQWNKIFKWTQKTATGDRAELDDLPEDDSIWPQICSSPDFCGAQKCPRATDCFISRLRKEAERSQIIVVNHHLFFADLAIREKGSGAVLPSYKVVIFDEAHLIEEIASHYFGYSVSNYRLDELVRDSVREADELNLKDKKEFIRDLDHLEARIGNFFHPFKTGTERRFSLSDIPADEQAAEVLLSSLAAMEEKISSIRELPDAARALAHRYYNIHEELSRIIAADDDEYIFWGESRGKGVFLYASSMDVAPFLKKSLYGDCGVVFTSATIASAGDFSYFRSRIGIGEDVNALALQSPFDFNKQVTIFLPDLPAPDDARFLDALAKLAMELIELVKGRTLFLFTSFRNMHEIKRRLEGRIKYPIIMQGEGPKHRLLERFTENIDSILLATSSFWQGVDVRGEALSCVIIDRLPFASPGDPVMAARIDHIRKSGGSPFTEYQLPEAVLALKQGLGRLIRHRNDRGIIMIADRRIKTKGYGKSFIASLPPAPVVDSLDRIEW